MRGKSCTSAEESDAEVRRFGMKRVTKIVKPKLALGRFPIRVIMPKPHDIASGRPAVFEIKFYPWRLAWKAQMKRLPLVDIQSSLLVIMRNA
jgi:hypothetical protein